ncbi:TRAP transporter substrate-binding protein DctP [Bacillaceae bacterium]
MFKTKRWFALTIVLMLVMSTVIGCGGNSSSEPATSQQGSSENASGSSGASGETLTLKLSHQWPQATADEGDFRSRLAVKFAEEVEKRTNGQVKIEIYPSSSLVKAQEQYEAMLGGALDMSVYPLDYAGGKVPQFGVTLMPALVKNHKQAQGWKDAEIGKKIEEIAEKNGIKILVWVWNAGAIGSKGEPIVTPKDIKPGMKMRAAGKLVEEMLASAGAGITSMASSEIYSALQTGVLDAAVTSASSFSSYKLYEQVDSFVSSRKNTFWFMFEPLVISLNTWNKLSPEQQKIFQEVAAELQPFAYEESIKDDENVTKLFEEKGVKVVDMDDQAFAQWLELAKPVWDKFAQEVEGGKELIDLAQKVSAQ